MSRSRRTEEPLLQQDRGSIKKVRAWYTACKMELTQGCEGLGFAPGEEGTSMKPRKATLASPASDGAHVSDPPAVHTVPLLQE